MSYTFAGQETDGPTQNERETIMTPAGFEPAASGLENRRTSLRSD
jgi:hypothetical protein